MAVIHSCRLAGFVLILHGRMSGGITSYTHKTLIAWWNKH
jgi:hypothetical protein